MKPIREWTLQEVKEYCTDKNNKCEECLLKYLLNPDELEDLTKLLESITGEFQPVVE